MKTYLGNGVHAEFDDKVVVLTSSVNGHSVTIRRDAVDALKAMLFADLLEKDEQKEAASLLSK